MFSKTYNILINDVYLIGCGGTGSRAVPLLVQLMKTSTRALNPHLYLIDGDQVELKNLERQNFITPDVGRNKAEVLAERYSAALEFGVTAHSGMITASNLRDIIQSTANDAGRAVAALPRIFIMCVDNMEARMDIIAQAGPNDIFIEAGNEDTFGNVSIFDNFVLRASENGNARPFFGEREIDKIPMPLDRLHNSIVNPSERTGSCADQDQSAAINNLMAAGINAIFQNLSYGIPIKYRTKFYDIAGSDRTEVMNINWLNREAYSQVATGTYNLRNTRSVPLRAWTNDLLAGVDFIPDNILNAVAANG